MEKNKRTFREKWTEWKAKHTEKRAEHKIKRAEKKAAKKEAKKEAYQSLDKKGKYKFWLIRAAAVIVLAVVVYLAAIYIAIPIIINIRYEYCVEQQASLEEIYAIAPPNEEQAEAINAMKPYDKEDTWAIYVYMCGSNLESYELNHLSDITSFLVQSEGAAYYEKESMARQGYIMDFISELNEQGMDLPEYMYLPQRPDEATEEDAPEYADMELWEGEASADLNEMLAVDLPKNMKIVYQFGGAARWSQPGINPNRSQRFVYDSNGFYQVDEQPVQNMGESETLADFLAFCEADYTADHKMLIFWNHGSGAFGFGSDELYEYDLLTLRELQDALGEVYKKDAENPPFEIVGFDACLMASVEVAEALNGYGRYLVASEETEPGEGWDYTKWLGALAENPQMNSAQVGKEIADSFINYYANQSIQFEWLGIDYGCTFSVVDISQAHKAYEAYGQLAAKVLKDSIEYPAYMGILGTAANGSVRYADTSYKIYNTLDLGLFMDNLMEFYPEEAGAVKQAVEKSVTYNRTTACEQGSQGLSVFFPAEMDEFAGFLYYLIYLNEVCEDEDIKALYYYKLAGCLNEEMQSYADSMGYGKAKPLDTTALEVLADVEPELLENGNFRLLLGEEALALIQDYSLNIAQYDEKEDKVIYYGEDQFLSIDDDGYLFTDFEGEWIAINGHFLAVEKIDATESTIRYRAPVSINGKDSYLILAYDFAEQKMSILGVRDMEDDGEMLTRNMSNIKSGDKLQAIYESNTLDSNVGMREYGKQFTYWADSRIEDETLDNGTYFAYATIIDTRGDEYYTPIIQFKMQGGKATDVEVRWDFINERSAD